MSKNRYKSSEENALYFITCTVVKWLPILDHYDVVEIVVESLKFLVQKKSLKIYGYVIMKNHLHLIVSCEKLSDRVRDFKSYTSRKIFELFEKKNSEFYIAAFKNERKNKRSIWMEGYHPQLIFSVEMFEQKLIYIHSNPVRKGYVDKPEDWQYSSARNFSGKSYVLGITRLKI